MNNYILGIMWSMGNLVKGRNWFNFQTSDTSKLYYMDKLAALKNKTVNKRKRISRGVEKDLYMLTITDSDYAMRIRDMGYDDPDVSFPENADDSFIAAVLELSTTKFSNNNCMYYRIYMKDCSCFDKLLLKCDVNRKKISGSSKNSINIGRNEMLKIAKYMYEVPDVNKKFWNEIIDECSDVREYNLQKKTEVH